MPTIDSATKLCTMTEAGVYGNKPTLGAESEPLGDDGVVDADDTLARLDLSEHGTFMTEKTDDVDRNSPRNIVLELKGALDPELEYEEHHGPSRRGSRISRRASAIDGGLKQPADIDTESEDERDTYRKKRYKVRTVLDTVGITELPYQEFNVRYKKAEAETVSEITGIALTKQGNMLVCDHGLGSIKLVDTDFNVIFTANSCFKPWSVAVLDATFFVVTYPFVRLMQYFKLKGSCSSFMPWFPVKARNEYYGVCGTMDRIFAVCKYDGDNLKYLPSVHVLTRQGLVIDIISKDHQDKQLFDEPEHIAIDTTTRNLYVSDIGAKLVLCLNLDGKVLAKFSVINFLPRGISMDDVRGYVYVSDDYSDSIFKFGQTLEVLQKLVPLKDSMTEPTGTKYCPKTDRLIVTTHRSFYVKTFAV